jgi:hypothetical protein
MQSAPKDLINEILGLSNANILLRDEIQRLRDEIQRLELEAQVRTVKQHPTPPMEKL